MLRLRGSIAVEEAVDDHSFSPIVASLCHVCFKGGFGHLKYHYRAAGPFKQYKAYSSIAVEGGSYC